MLLGTISFHEFLFGSFGSPVGTIMFGEGGIVLIVFSICVLLAWHIFVYGMLYFHARMLYGIWFACMFTL